MFQPQPYGQAPPPPTPPNQYDFIVNYGAQSSRRNPLMNNFSTKKSVLVVAGGILLLLIVVWLFVSLLSNSNRFNAAPLINLAQRQSELARIAEIASRNSSQQATRNFATNVQLSFLSEQQSFLTFLHRHGSKPSTALLQALKNNKTDASLQTAQSTGTYDQTFMQIAQTELTAYQQAIKTTFTKAQATSERQLLNEAYEQAQLLLKQSGQNT